MNRIFICLILFLVIFSQCEKNENHYVNWISTFDSQDKIPLGTYILYKELKTLFPFVIIKKIGYNTQDFLNEKNIYNSNYIFIYPVINYNRKVKNTIANFTAKENYTFLSAYYFRNVIPKNIKDSSVIIPPSKLISNNDSIAITQIDSLKKEAQEKEIFTNDFDIGYEEETAFPPIDNRATDSLSELDYLGISNELKKLTQSTQTHQFIFTNPIFENDTFTIKGYIKGLYFKSLPEKAEVLGYIKIHQQFQPNFIRIPYNEGWYYIHLEPLVFSNIAMFQKDINQYVGAVFSFLPNKTIYWDNYNILSKQNQRKMEGGLSSLLSFAWKHPNLKIGMGLLLCAAILFVVFNSRRRQQAIAYVPPLKNSLLEYSSSLSHIFKKTTNYKYLCTIKIQYFRNLISENYYIDKVLFQKEFAQQLHLKSGVELIFCENLVHTIQHIQNAGFCNKQDFKKLSQQLHYFYTNSNLYGKHSSGKPTNLLSFSGRN